MVHHKLHWTVLASHNKAIAVGSRSYEPKAKLMDNNPRLTWVKRLKNKLHRLPGLSGSQTSQNSDSSVTWARLMGPESPGPHSNQMMDEQVSAGCWELEGDRRLLSALGLVKNLMENKLSDSMLDGLSKYTTVPGM